MLYFWLIASIATIAVIMLGVIWWFLNAAAPKKKEYRAYKEQSNDKLQRDRIWDAAVAQTRNGPR